MASSSTIVEQQVIRPRILAPTELHRWDAFVETHPLGLAVHTSAWLRGVEGAFAHIRGSVVVLEEAHSGRIVAGLPLYTVRSWLRGTRVVSVPFASICDPLIDDAEQAKALVGASVTFASERKAKVLEIRSLHTQHLLSGSPLFSRSGHLHHVLSLAPPEEKIRQSFAKSAVQNEITRARKAGVETRVSHDKGDLVHFHAIVTETRRRLSLPPIPIKFFQSIWTQFSPRHARLYFAMKDNAPVAALLTTHFRGLCSAEFSGDLRLPGVPGVNQAVYWKAIVDAKAEGYHQFSFGRTAVQNDALRQYKKRWGTTEEDITTFSNRPSTQKKGREDSLVYKSARKVIRHLPAPVFRQLGDFIYRHLG